MPRLVPQLSKKKTPVVLEHSILTAVWHILTDNVDYPTWAGSTLSGWTPNVPCVDWPDKANALGFTIRFDPIEGAA